MVPTGANNSFALRPALLAEVEAAADQEHRPIGEVVREALERYLAEGSHAEILAHVDAAEVSIARGEGIPITPDAMHQLAADVKQRGRARLTAENSAPR